MPLRRAIRCSKIFQQPPKTRYCCKLEKAKNFNTNTTFFSSGGSSSDILAIVKGALAISLDGGIFEKKEWEHYAGTLTRLQLSEQLRQVISLSQCQSYE